MATCLLNSLAFWGGTVANIPAGWTRDTAFDGKYLQGVTTKSYTGPVNGGASDHTHTRINEPHTHVYSSTTHTHSLTSNTRVGFGGNSVGSAKKNNRYQVGETHTHSAAKATNSSTADFNDATVTFDVEAAIPHTVELIVITPDDALQQLPDDVVVALASTTIPTGFAAHTEASTFRHVRGSAGAADGGGTAGTTTHNHSQSHTHTPVSSTHNHGGSMTSGSQSGASLNATSLGSGTSAYGAAHHSIPLNTVANPNLSTNTTASTTVAHAPIARKVKLIQNTSGGDKDIPAGCIMGYKGSFASFDNSTGWYVADGKHHPITLNCSDHQLVAGTDGEFGTEVGSRLHSHFHDHGHTDSLGTHTHTLGTVTGTSSPGSYPSGAVDGLNDNTHTHSTWTLTSTDGSVTVVDDGQNTSEEDARQPYRTVLWIQFVGVPSMNIPGSIHLVGDVSLAGT